MCHRCKAEGLSWEQSKERHQNHTKQLSLDEIQDQVLEADEVHRRPTHRFTEEEMDIIVRFLEREATRDPQE